MKKRVWTILLAAVMLLSLLAGCSERKATSNGFAAEDSYYVKTEEHLSFANKYIGGYKVMSLTPSILQNYFDILDARRKTTIRIKPKPDFE